MMTKFNILIILIYCLLNSSCIKPKAIKEDKTHLVKIRKVELLYKIYSQSQVKQFKKYNYYIDDNSFITSYNANSSYLRVINNQWFYKQKDGTYSIFITDEENIPKEFKFYYLDKRHNITFETYDIVRILSTNCVDGIKVYKVGIYNSSTWDLLGTQIIAPRIGTISYLPPGGYEGTSTRLDSISEFDKNGNLIKTYPFILKEFYKKKYGIENECK